MKGMADEEWFGRLKEAIADDGRSHSTISLKAELGRNYVQQMIAKDTPPKRETLEKLLTVLGPEAASRVRGTALPNEVRAAAVDLPRTMAKDVPVRGTVAGADYGKGAFQLSPDIIDYVRRPPALADAKDVYALYVEGSSMEPRFEAGELIFVNPNRPARPGDYVVIQEPVSEDETRGFVKQLVKRTGDWVVCRQLNPVAELRFKATPALRVHRVLTTSDMLGI